MSNILLIISFEKLQQYLQNKNKGTKLNPVGHHHFNSTGHTSTNLGTGDINMTDFIINGTHHKVISKIFYNKPLPSLYSQLGWSSCDNPLRNTTTQKGLAKPSQKPYKK